MGIESGSNPAEEAARQHEAKMKRQRTVDAKVAGIRNNPGETRSEAEIRAQAEREEDAGESNEKQFPEKPEQLEKYKLDADIRRTLFGYDGGQFDSYEMERELRKSLEKNPSSSTIGTHEFRKDLEDRFFQIWKEWPEFQRSKRNP